MQVLAGRCSPSLLCFLMAAAGVGDSIGASRSTLYIVRAPSVSMMGMNAEVQVDGLAPFTLGPNGCVLLEPHTGVRKVMYRWRAGPLGNQNLQTEFTAVPISLVANQASYLRLLSHTDSVTNVRGGIDTTITWKMEQVPEQEVKSYLPRCKARVPAQARD